MSVERIWQGLTEVFREVFDNDQFELRPDLSAHDVPEWDSMRMILIVAGAEERFGVKLGSRQIEQLRNVGDLVKMLQAKGA